MTKTLWRILTFSTYGTKLYTDFYSV